ncbi:hypothetical protein LTR36_005271 [Oleoguttula mirabilis]|uniref:Uncharacterized protein n=1 Tax=Oleoguttula mirabilis TaxID=1507867 RepID=A0AAV9JF02_9PEZI|nr:hypothetical protein LTR36_005271 [Oleoguttula mirabilis]
MQRMVEDTLQHMMDTGDSGTPGFECNSYPHVSSATPPTCSQGCRICSRHYLPLTWQVWDTYAQKYTDHDAHVILRECVRTTEHNLSYVSSKLQTYGDAILKRWQKRNVEKRARLLLKAMPEMYQHKWFESRPKRSPQSTADRSLSSAAARSGWLLPYLSVEALSQDWTKLLALMHVRTVYRPAQWMAFDNDSQQNGFESALLDLGYNPHCVAIDEKHFGELVQWNREKAHRLEMIGFPRAHLAFEAQSELSGLLRRMVDLLLGDTGDDTPQGSDLWDASAKTGFNVSGSGVVAESAYYLGPYSAPCRFDADRIQSLLLGRCAAAKDTLWLLQRDPWNFREYLAQAQSTSYHRQLPEEEKIDHLIRHTLSAVNHVDLASRMLDEVNMIMDIMHDHEEKIMPGEPLPQEYDDALSMMRSTLVGQFNTQTKDLFDIVTHVSTFQHHFYRDESGRVKYLTSPAQALRTDKLFWNIMSLSDGNVVRTYKPAWHFAYIDDILANAPRREKERVDQTIYDQLSDMAAIDEALVVVESHGPYFTRIPSIETNRAMRVKYGLQYHHDMLARLLNSWNDAEERLRAPLKELLVLPLPSAKVNGDSYVRTARLHEAVCKFWEEAARVRFEGLQREGIIENDAGAHVRNLCVGKTDSYRRVKAEELGALNFALSLKGAQTPARQAKSNKTLEVASPSQTVWGGTSSGRNIATTTPKAKQKTRRAPADDFPAALGGLQIEAEEAQPAEEKPVIAVGHDSLCLFQRMFTSSATSKSTADTRWEDFVSALRDAGCSARQNGGSAIAFAHDMAPRDLVVIHRPHPDPTINPIMLRSFGKKLEKHFDWGVDTFVEREKEGKAKGACTR